MADSISKTKPQRIEWIDVAKGIGVIAVVFAHASTKYTYLWNTATLFHIPLFYIIAGYLYKNENSKRYIQKKIKSLWVPYVVFSLGVYIFQILCGFISLNSSLLKLVVKTLLLINTPSILGAAWFISTLFYAELGYLLFRKVIDWINTRVKVHLFVELLISSVLVTVGMNTNIKYNISRIIVAIGYISIGSIIRRDTNVLPALKKTYIWPTKALLLFSTIIFMILPIGRYSSYVSNTYTNFLVSILGAVLGAVYVIVISQFLCKHRWHGFIQNIGKNTIGIVLLQFIAFKIVNFVMVVYYGIENIHIFDFPIIYEYVNPFWTVLYTLVGLYVSIGIYKVYEMAKGVIIRNRNERELL